MNHNSLSDLFWPIIYCVLVIKAGDTALFRHGVQFNLYLFFGGVFIMLLGTVPLVNTSFLVLFALLIINTVWGILRHLRGE